MCLGNINNNYGGGAKASAQAFPVQNGGVGVTGEIQSSDKSVTVTGTGVVNQSGKPVVGGIGVKTNQDGVSVGGNVNFDRYGPIGGNIGISSNNGDGMTTYGNINFDNNGQANGGLVGIEYRF